MHRLLFVDDEPRVLDSLRRQLFSRRAEWEFHFATSGEAALDTLNRAEFDVLITDIRMPGMDGATLLEEARKRYPGMIRIVLSGQCDSVAATRALAAAHRYLSKPCDAEALKQTLERALELRSAMDEPKLRTLLHRVGDLPHPPKVCTELDHALADPEPSFEHIATLLSEDPALVVRVMQFANSAFFSGSERTTGIDAAIGRLGTTVLRSLVLSALLRDSFTPGKVLEGFDVRVEQAHSMLVGAIARELARPWGFGDQAFTAALLHDVGKLVLASRLPDEYGEALRQASHAALPLPQVEHEVLGASHAEVGAYLLALWGLPADLVTAVRLHHEPIASFPTQLDPTSVVIIANHLAREHDRAAPISLPALDQRWTEWRDIAETTRRLA